MCWCERGDSNPHGFTRQILSLVRLPIPPLSQRYWIIQSGWLFLEEVFPAAAAPVKAQPRAGYFS